MRGKKCLCGALVLFFLVICFAGFPSVVIAEQEVGGRIERLEKEIKDLRSRIITLEELVEKIFMKAFWKITLEKTGVDRSVKDPGRGPDIKVVVYLNAMPIFDTETSKYSFWYELAARDTYRVVWYDDIPARTPDILLFNTEEGEQWREKARSALSMELEFGFGDELVVELWDRDPGGEFYLTKEDKWMEELKDRDPDEDDLIARWRVDDPSQLVNLVSDGNYVTFKVERTSEEKE